MCKLRPVWVQAFADSMLSSLVFPTTSLPALSLPAARNIKRNADFWASPVWVGV
ncbi:hypothetical protein CY34DRAFT_805210 [Suillus luteus UH-Slu-Lm8-n1]|uniref:Uncharacterized protein n=1 Tax=Suillus luteus UH-Slu-Lm8-n1 TaxID=930992 RepID=A0A0D0B6N8_9AGAM|nr:hypothetical protein CY34DRAFT_805210 [Suillus luteus UH-Slu-Lm8-n1]